MTITSNVAKAVYLTNPAVTNYTFPFKIFAADQIYAAVVEPVTGNMTVLALTTDYTVDGLGQDTGGMLTLTASGVAKAGTGSHMVLMRDMAIVQTVDYRPHDIFPAETHERALDILTMICQELSEKISRAIIAPPDKGASEVTYETLAELGEATQAAADTAQQAADTATQAATAASASSDTAQAAATAAETAADSATLTLQQTMDLRDEVATTAQSVTAAEERVQEISDNIHELGAQAQTLEPGQPATAAYNSVTGNMEFGIPQGPRGIQGETGTGVHILGLKASEADLPATGVSGDAWMVGTAEPYDMYVWDVSDSLWVNVGPIKGDDGEPGPPGADGMPVLADNITYYLSAAGDDANDGLTATTPKLTWSAIVDLLAQTNPGRYMVTVQVAGLIPLANTMALAQYSPSNLLITGADQAADGFSENFRCLAGGFQFDKVQFGQLHIGNSGAIYAQGRTVRFTGGSGAAGYAIGANAAMGKIQLVGCTIEHTGTYDAFLNIEGGNIRFTGCAYVQVGTATVVNTASIKMDVGGEYDIDNPDDLPGGGTVVATNPGVSNIRLATPDPNTGGTPLLSVLWTASEAAEPGYLDISQDNGLLLRSLFPDAWAKISLLSPAMLLADADWIAEQTANGGVCGKYSSGDGSTTFRVPYIKGLEIAAADDARAPGAYETDMMRPIIGDATNVIGNTDYTQVGGNGAFIGQELRNISVFGAIGLIGPFNTRLHLDSSLLGPNYAGAETHSKRVFMRPLLRMYGAITNLSDIDVANVMAALNKKQSYPDLSTMRLIGIPANESPPDYLGHLSVTERGSYVIRATATIGITNVYPCFLRVAASSPDETIYLATDFSFTMTGGETVNATVPAIPGTVLRIWCFRGLVDVIRFYPST